MIDWYDRSRRTSSARCSEEGRQVRAEAMGGARIPGRPGVARRHRVLDPSQRAGPHRRGAADAAGRVPVPQRADAGPEAAFQAHADAWAPTSTRPRVTRASGRRPTYRSDLHVLVEAPDGTMAASTIMWLDEANQTAEFEPVGTHPGYRRLGLGTAMLLHGMHLAREAGSHSHDGRMSGCARASAGARAVLRSRVPAVHARRAADQACGLVPGPESEHEQCRSAQRQPPDVP